MIAATLRCSCAGRRGVTGCQSAGTKPCRMLRAFARGTSGRNRGTRTLVLTAATLAVLVAASQVGSAQAYGCTDSAQCQYSPCNDQPCSSSSSECVNGKWRSACGGPYELAMNLESRCYYGGFSYSCSDPQPCPAGQYSIGGGKNGGGDYACRSCDAGKYVSTAGLPPCVCARARVRV
jgi:hypothetical protein